MHKERKGNLERRTDTIQQGPVERMQRVGLTIRSMYLSTRQSAFIGHSCIRQNCDEQKSVLLFLKSLLQLELEGHHNLM